MTEPTQRCNGQTAVSRRVVVTGVGLAGMSVAVAACGGNDSKTASLKTASGSSVAAADVPVGGAVLLSDISVIVTQPSSGTFRAFSSVCPHQGCAVSDITGSTLVCPCHGSEFEAATGKVTHGPATTGLTAKKAAKQGDKIVVS